MFEKLLQFPRKKILEIITLVATGIFILATIVMAPYSTALADAGPTIIDFEFVWTSNRAEAVLSAYVSAGVLEDAEILNILDYLYMVGYGLMIFGLDLLVTRQLEGKPQKYGLVISTAALLAAILDAVENANLLIMIGSPSEVQMINALLASLFATIKFGLVFVGIGYFFVALGIWVYQRRQKTPLA